MFVKYVDLLFLMFQEYGSLENCPEFISGRIVEMECFSVTEVCMHVLDYFMTELFFFVIDKVLSRIISLNLLLYIWSVVGLNIMKKLAECR